MCYVVYCSGSEQSLLGGTLWIVHGVKFEYSIIYLVVRCENPLLYGIFFNYEKLFFCDILWIVTGVLVYSEKLIVASWYIM